MTLLMVHLFFLSWCPVCSVLCEHNSCSVRSSWITAVLQLEGRIWIWEWFACRVLGSTVTTPIWHYGASGTIPVSWIWFISTEVSGWTHELFSFLLGGASSYTCLLIGCCCVVRFEISIVFLFGHLSILFMLTYITIMKFSVCLKIYMSKMKHCSICEYKLQNGCWAGINIVIFNSGESDTSEMGFCKCWSVIWVSRRHHSAGKIMLKMGLLMWCSHLRKGFLTWSLKVCSVHLICSQVSAIWSLWQEYKPSLLKRWAG